MSIQSDIYTALAAVAGGRVFPAGEVPEGVPLPLVTYRRTLHAPIMTLGGYEGTTNSIFVFECWGETTATASAKQSALDVAAAVIAAIEAAAGLVRKYRTDVSGEDYDPETLETMEPVSYSFWHA